MKCTPACSLGAVKTAAPPQFPRKKVAALVKEYGIQNRWYRCIMHLSSLEELRSPPPTTFSASLSSQSDSTAVCLPNKPTVWDLQHNTTCFSSIYPILYASYATRLAPCQLQTATPSCNITLNVRQNFCFNLYISQVEYVRRGQATPSSRQRHCLHTLAALAGLGCFAAEDAAHKRGIHITHPLWHCLACVALSSGNSLPARQTAVLSEIACA